MSEGSVQPRIDAIQWYHEFDFGNGLRARSCTPDVEMHRQLWMATVFDMSGVLSPELHQEKTSQLDGGSQTNLSG